MVLSCEPIDLSSLCYHFYLVKLLIVFWELISIYQLFNSLCNAKFFCIVLYKQLLQSSVNHITLLQFSCIAVGSGCTAVHMLKATKKLCGSLLQMSILILHSKENLRCYIFRSVFSSCIVIFFFDGSRKLYMMIVPS